MKSLKAQITFTVLIIFIITFLAAAFYTYVQQKRVILSYEGLRAKDYATFIKSLLKDKEEQAGMGAYIISKTPQYVELFASGKREELYKNLEEMWKGLKGKFKVAQFQFHKPPAISFLRVHKPQKFGDDLSSFRKTVLETNRRKEMILGVEKGRAGFGIRGVVPVFKGSEHVGSVEFGLSLGKDFLKSLKEKLGGEWFFYSLLEGISWEEKNYFGTMDEDVFKVDEEAVEKVRSGTEAFYLDKDHEKVIVLIPVEDFSGKVVAYIKGVLNTEYFTALRKVATRLSIVVVLSLVVIILIVYIYMTRIFRNLEDMAKAFEKIAEGDLTVRMDVKGENEIAKLASVVNGMMEKFSESLKILKDSSIEVSRFSEDLGRFAMELASDMSDVRRSMEEVTGRVENTSAAIEEVTSGVDEVASGAQNLSRMSQDLSNLAGEMEKTTEEGRRSIDLVAESVEDVAERIEETAAVVEEVAKKSESIGEIVETINSIAEQTNLLALNAAIEAARAGSGERFCGRC